MTQRRVSNPLALAVLACLAERPMHPYEMASTMRERHKDDAIKLNYGSLYSVIDALCRHQLIVAKETLRQGNRPERTVFQLTETGQHELSDWLSELLARPAKEYLQFEAGLSLMPALPPENVATLLKDRADWLEVELAKARSIKELADSRKVPRLFMIESEYRNMLRTAELTWVRALAADVASGKIEGFAEWRSWYSDAAPKAS
jgi:DNA-binding PadR family transcriptional regulator